MAQGTLNIINQGFPSFRADLNNQLEVLATLSSGPTPPTTTYPFQLWVDTSQSPSVLKQRNAANNAFIDLGSTDGLLGNAAVEQVAQLSDGLFAKSDSSIVAWSKTGNNTAQTSQQIKVFVDGNVRTIASGTSITMPTLTAGSDLAIWVNPDGTLQASTSFTTPPVAGGRKVGGFHYAPGGNASFALNAGNGGTTPQINQFSFYDLKWKPSAPDPRGLTLVANAFWVGIYNLAQNHLSGAPHRHGVAPARDGNAPQFINGSGNYPNASPMNLFEVLNFHGFTTLRVQDFQLAAFGTNEEASRGSAAATTGLPGGNTDAQFTSTWGVIQSTGVLGTWSNDSILSTADQTLPNPSRGGRFRVSHFAALGGTFIFGAASGSRVVFTITATASSTNRGSRGRCDHVILV